MQAPLAQSAWLLVALPLWLAAPSQAAPILEVSGQHAASLMGSYDADTRNYWSVSYDSLDHMVRYSGKVSGKSFTQAFAASELAPGSVVYPAAHPGRVRGRGAVVPEPSAALLMAVSLLAIHLRSRHR